VIVGQDVNYNLEPDASTSRISTQALARYIFLTEEQLYCLSTCREVHGARKPRLPSLVWRPLGLGNRSDHRMTALTLLKSMLATCTTDSSTLSNHVAHAMSAIDSVLQLADTQQHPFDHESMQAIGDAVVSVMQCDWPTTNKLATMQIDGHCLVHVASYLLMQSVVELLIGRADDGGAPTTTTTINTPIGRSRTPISSIGSTALHVVCSLAESPESRSMIGMLLRNKANVNARDLAKATPLMVASMSGNTASVSDLCNHLYQTAASPAAAQDMVNTKMEGQLTALHASVETNNTELSQLLIEARADVNCRTIWGDNALDLAVQCDAYESARLLIMFGAHRSERTSNQNSRAQGEKRSRADDIGRLISEQFAEVRSSLMWRVSNHFCTSKSFKATVKAIMMIYETRLDSPLATLPRELLWHVIDALYAGVAREDPDRE
jgi:hypothetical protein